jgi:hypothetical protein
MNQNNGETKPAKHPGNRKDLFALWGGILFSFAFTGLIWWAGSRLESIPHLPDLGPSWYFWQLPEPTFWGRTTAWVMYAAHQIAIWSFIYYAQTRKHKYITGLHTVNYLALIANAAFILLHFIQTHLWYDGLAQDVSIWSSQGSVILLLVMVLLMENRRRGMFFGRKVPLSRRIVDFARKYHGYFFSWGIVYTFWYHPMEATSGHLVGFFYMFLLMLQGSLFFTRIHLNRWWTLLQEILVAVHGTLVAVMQGNDLWPMFFFGFAGIFVITQMHGLRISFRLRAGILALYILGATWVYGQRELTLIHQITWIPVIEYLAVFLIAGLIGLGIWIVNQFRNLSKTFSEEVS